VGNVLHFLLGSVRLEVTGRFPERFVNLCGAKKVPFWDTERPEEQILRLMQMQSAKLWKITRNM
jgi:similar to stage IV sporulation protein